ncbi:MAG: hypothetical protein ACTSQ8_21265 [Candidatus Helarchaeota archaeon]
MQERENILRILKGVEKALGENDALAIKNLSNQTINTASLTQDPDNIAVAVIVYAIGKIFEKKVALHEEENFKKVVAPNIKNLIVLLEKNDLLKFRKVLKRLRTQLQEGSGKLKEYIEFVFRKAKINKASRIYEHGISMEQTARLLGISLYELALYAGGIEEKNLPKPKGSDVRRRIKLAMEIFK